MLHIKNELDPHSLISLYSIQGKRSKHSVVVFTQIVAALISRNILELEFVYVIPFVINNCEI